MWYSLFLPCTPDYQKKIPVTLTYVWDLIKFDIMEQKLLFSTHFPQLNINKITLLSSTKLPNYGWTNNPIFTSRFENIKRTLKYHQISKKKNSTGVANKIKIAFDSTMYEQATVVDSQQWNKSSI
jgi:hypothetical protein